LLAAVDAALGPWVVRCVTERWTQARGRPVPEEVAVGAVEAAEQARTEVLAAMGALLAADIDDQRTNPLALLRRAVLFPTAVLRAAGVPPVVRDRFAERTLPDDLYALAPATWADVDPALHEPGLVWGAAKAHVALTRRKHRS
jgi:hypothetical protein